MMVKTKMIALKDSFFVVVIYIDIYVEGTKPMLCTILKYLL